jgi:cytochrome c oxidase subunit II
LQTLLDTLRRIGSAGRPLDASTNAWHGDALFAWVTIVLGVVLLIVLAQLALVILRSRAATPPSASRGDDARSRLLVIAGTLALIALVDVVSLWRSSQDLPSWVLRAPQPGEVQVEVMAQQWAWSFRYAGNDGRFGTDDDVVQLNTLTLPAGTPARLELRSKDVIHSLFIPSLRLKRDAQPGATTELYLEPARVGSYELACAQHCGANHYLMRGTLEIVSAHDYARWLAEESALAKARFHARPEGSNWAWPFIASAQGQ